MEETTTPKTSPKLAPAKRYYTKSGGREHVPGLNFVITDKNLQEDFTIRAIENFEKRTGKNLFGTILELR